MKYISLNHGYDALQWYEPIHTHSDTWGLLIPPSTNISKDNPMGDSWKRQSLSDDTMSKRLYTIKLITKILNKKTMFGPECSYFR